MLRVITTLPSAPQTSMRRPQDVQYGRPGTILWWSETQVSQTSYKDVWRTNFKDVFYWTQLRRPIVVLREASFRFGSKSIFFINIKDWSHYKPTADVSGTSENRQLKSEIPTLISVTICHLLFLTLKVTESIGVGIKMHFYSSCGFHYLVRNIFAF